MKPLVKLIRKKKRERTQITNIMNEREVITRNLTDVKNTIKHNKQFYDNKIVSLDEMG